MTDARLLVPAGGAWLGAGLAGWRVSVPDTLAGRHDVAVTLAWLAVGMSVAGTVLVLALLRRHRHGARLVMVAGLGLVCGVGAVVVVELPRSADPLAAWVDARATATVVGVVSGEPVRRDRPGAAAWQQPAWVEARVVAGVVRARGSAVLTGVPMIVRLPPQQMPPAGGTIAVTGRLGPAAPRSDAAAQLATSSAAEDSFVMLRPPGPVDRIAQAMRTSLRGSLADQAPEPASLVAGLAIGDESSQPAELTAAMRTSGLSHLTAVSGGNVAIILGAVLLALSVVRVPLVATVIASVLTLLFFVVLVGPEPSVLRAAVMGAVIVVGLLAGGRRAGPAPLGAAVLGLVLLQPALARSWGFALSVAATAGLLLLLPAVRVRLARWPPLRRCPPALLTGLAVTTTAQLATGPLLVLMVGTVGWVAVPANLLAMPVVPLVTVVGLATAVVGPVAPGPASLLGAAAAWPAGWIATVAQVGSDLPGAQLGTPALIIVAACIVLLVLRRSLDRFTGTRWHGRASAILRALVAAALAATALVVLVPPGRRGWPPPGWLVIMCDVGQGDALVVRAGPGSAVVVDAGPDPDATDRCLTDAGIAAVPALVLTHFHADHVGGLAGVLRGRQVASVIASPVREPVEQAQRVTQVLGDHGLRLEPVTAGDERRLPGLSWQVLWPRRRIAAGSVPNNASLVLAVEVGGRSLLLAGDIEPEAQAALAVDLRRRTFDVVKVPHHGSRFQAPGFVGWAPAPIALVSVGAGNDYGHPAPETLAAWSGIGALVGRTDLHGDVAVVESGSGLGLVVRDGMLPSS